MKKWRTMTNRIIFRICQNYYHFSLSFFGLDSVFRGVWSLFWDYCNIKYRASTRQTKGIGNNIWLHHFLHLNEIVSRTFYLFVRLHLRACLKIYIWAVRRGRLFVLHTSNSYSNPYATPIPACHRARSVLLLSPDNLAFFPGEMAERSFLLRATSILVTNFRVHHLSLFLKTWANVGESYCTEECSKRTLTESSFLWHFVRDSFLFCVLPYMADSDVTQTSS